MNICKFVTVVCCVPIVFVTASGDGLSDTLYKESFYDVRFSESSKFGLYVFSLQIVAKSSSYFC